MAGLKLAILEYFMNKWRIGGAVLKCTKVYVYFGDLTPGKHFNTLKLFQLKPIKSSILDHFDQKSCFWDNYN